MLDIMMENKVFTMKTENDYKQWLIDLKTRIRQSQIKAAIKLNAVFGGI